MATILRNADLDPQCPDSWFTIFPSLLHKFFLQLERHVSSANYETLGLVYVVGKGIFNNKHTIRELSCVPLKYKFQLESLTLKKKKKHQKIL